jgi:hypothetical protein
VIVGVHCGDCVRLYAWLDCEIGDNLRRADWYRTVAQAAKALSWQPRTALRHAEHLEAAGLVSLKGPGGKASPRLRVRHQPARGLVNRDVTLTGRRPPRRSSETGQQIVARLRDGRGRWRNLDGETTQEETRGADRHK